MTGNSSAGKRRPEVWPPYRKERFSGRRGTPTLAAIRRRAWRAATGRFGGAFGEGALPQERFDGQRWNIVRMYDERDDSTVRSANVAIPLRQPAFRPLRTHMSVCGQGVSARMVITLGSARNPRQSASPSSDVGMLYRPPQVQAKATCTPSAVQSFLSQVW